MILYGPPGTRQDHDRAARRAAPPTRASKSTAPSSSAGPTPSRRSPRPASGCSISGRRTVYFLDEIHRFNKAQQDALLPAVEDGAIILIGATTENPYFEVNGALLSRLRLYVLEPLDRRRRARAARQARSPTRAGSAARYAIADPTRST